ncbi:DHH family phosphoesterase, partial [Thermodesulfobacteriota bacterium]
IIVSSGIEMMKNTIWPGLKSIQETAGINSSNITSGELAYRMAPRLNAPGRMGDSQSGLETLTTRSLSKAREMAEHLDSMNRQRQAIEGEIIDQIEESIIPHIELKTRRVLVIHDEGWHKGVLGIVASRLLNKYHRPVVVLTIQDGTATGSGRSIDGFDLYKALRKLEHLLVKYGGHYHAAGLTIKEDNLAAFSEGLEDLAKEELDTGDLIPSVEVDAEVSLEEITVDSVQQMGSIAPFGARNPEPVFYARHLEVLSSRIVGERHLKLKVGQGDRAIEAIGFNLAKRYPLDGETIDLLFTPEIDSWNGHEKLQLRIVDLELTDKVQIKTN